MVELSVIIVTFNHAATLRRTLESLLTQQGVTPEIIVLDNASGDESPAIALEFRARGVRVLQSRVNRGFSGGNNDAASVAHGKLLLLANPDLEFTQPDTLQRLLAAYAADPSLGVVGFKLYAADGRTLLHCGGTIGLPAHTIMRGRGELDTGQFPNPEEVEFVEGAALAVPRELWQRLGGLNTDFWPGYYEETDFCVRARRAGARVTWRPELTAIHHTRTESVETDGPFWRMLQTNRVLFTLHWLGPWALLTQALPAEWRWLTQPGMRYLRPGVLRAYARVGKRLAGKFLGRPIAPPSDFIELSAESERTPEV